MFGRLKQKVKEKTGRAQATQLPDDVSQISEFYKGFPNRLKHLASGFNDLDSMLKAKHRHEMAEALSWVSEANKELDVKGCVEFHKKRAMQEGELMGKISMETEKLKSYQNQECKQHSQAVSNLNKWRLNMDSANGAFESNQSDQNKLKVDNATREYEEACNRIRELYKNIPSEEETHQKIVTTLCQNIAAHYKN
ncbi:unnamed protein product [Caenorhabditis angaria]|uniref:BAR domain-containing protein n=1 Tax=Caenorhabditis angaria TaxID=860376 RepID=A0A9P1MXR0_9PELO|nr:unnamed protein product [Caenorhabditis angaria]